MVIANRNALLKHIRMKRIILRKTRLLIVIVVSFFTLSSFKNAPIDRVSIKPITLNYQDSTKGFRNLLSKNSRKSTDTIQFEINDKTLPFVKDYLSKSSSMLEKMREWGEPYFVMFDKILSQNSLPVELKYLSVIESSLQSGSVSSAGAVGPWQLMPDDAKRWGLIVNSNTDERKSYYKSTQAASKLIKDLYAQFNDWLLVIAAYNAGSGAVRRAITKSGSRNFWDLQRFLPEETRNHVKKYIATHYFFEQNGGWTTLTATETNEKILALESVKAKEEPVVTIELDTAEVIGKYNSVAVAKYLSMDIVQFTALNPSFDKVLAEGKFYTIRLPIDKLEIFKEKKQLILQESVQLFLSGTASESAPGR